MLIGLACVIGLTAPIAIAWALRARKLNEKRTMRDYLQRIASREDADEAFPHSLVQAPRELDAIVGCPHGLGCGAYRNASAEAFGRVSNRKLFLLKKDIRGNNDLEHFLFLRREIQLRLGGKRRRRDSKVPEFRKRLAVHHYALYPPMSIPQD